MSPIIDLKHVLIFIKMNSLKGNILQSRTFIKTFQYNDKKLSYIFHLFEYVINFFLEKY